MGANLSSTKVVDTSKDIVGVGDAQNDMRLALLWLGAFYAMGMIGATLGLVDRWKGPRSERRVGFASVLAAMLLSTAWPLVMVYLLFAS